MAEVRAVLQRCDPALLDPCGDSEQPDCAEAAKVFLYLTQSEQLDESLQKAQNALQVCDRQLTQLRAESEAALGHLVSWQRLRDKLQVFISAAQDVMQINLLSFNQSELCVELRTRPSSDHNVSSNELVPLKLSVTWSHDDRFRLQ
eukprot:superscaffoldBa00001620_g11329